MKKFLIFAAAALVLCSCLDDKGSYSAEYWLPATFEYDNFYDMDKLFGSDSLYFDDVYGLGLSWNSDLAFYHKLNEAKTEFEGGFILTRLKGEVYDPSGRTPDKDADIYRVNAPADSTTTYLTFLDSSDSAKMPEHDIEFINWQYGTCTMYNAYVCVPEYVAYAASQYFTDGDSLTVKAVGYLDQADSKEVSIVLASCEGGVVKVEQMWKLWDMSALGKFRYLDFEVVSTNKDVPAVFCLDNMLVKVAVEY